MKRSVAALALAISVLTVSAQASSQAVAELADNMDALTQAKIALMKAPAGAVAAKKIDGAPALRKEAATIGYAEIKSSDYNFEWMLFSGGWYWNTSDDYSSFYDLDQDFEDFSTYNATFTLFVYRTSTTPYEAATTDINVANSLSATIYKNRVDTTFAGEQAYRNSYSYVNSGYNFSVDTWSFSNSGVTYKYRIFTLVDDWNANYSIYLLMANLGLDFSDSPVAKRREDALPQMFAYHPAPGGRVHFQGTEQFDRIYIYDLAGKLIRSLSRTNAWDGLDNAGKPVRSGYYVSNLHVGDIVRNMGVQMK